jgi:hypothetical protein
MAMTAFQTVNPAKVRQETHEEGSDGALGCDGTDPNYRENGLGSENPQDVLGLCHYSAVGETTLADAL